MAAEADLQLGSEENASLKATQHDSTSMLPFTILIGLSGPSSSGKTTLARLLRTIFNNISATTSSSTPTLPPSPQLSLFILHEDDFYLTDKLVPIRSIGSTEFGTRDLQDWDCVESLDLDLFEETLRHVKTYGRVPDGSVSKEDENSVGESGVSDDEVRRLTAVVEEWYAGLLQKLAAASPSATQIREIRICILDGFLLYPPPPSQTSSAEPPTPQSQLYALTSTLLSPRLFLPTTLPYLLHRRLNRTGYVTLEGFWTDPPGYVQDVVWPNYVRDHAWMYVDGDVEGKGMFDDDVLRREGVLVCPGGGEWGMARMLGWAVQRVQEAVEERVV